MKTIDLIGGMSWESSAEYYRIINEEAATGTSNGALACFLYEQYDLKKKTLCLSKDILCTPLLK